MSGYPAAAWLVRGRDVDLVKWGEGESATVHEQ
jgi:hypothetical protein